jgi:hypothetical protein
MTASRKYRHEMAVHRSAQRIWTAARNEAERVARPRHCLIPFTIHSRPTTKGMVLQVADMQIIQAGMEALMY